MKFWLVIFLTIFFIASSNGQTYVADIKRESARSDKLTGGRIEKAGLVPGDGNVKITINLPAFQITLWQGGKEISSYPIGIGKIDYPVAISLRQASSIDWNPVWIPPSSDWIEKSSTVKAGEIVLPTDPRNPLGKVKIPLGYGYLIHQAKGAADMGGLVSHGCIRVMQRGLYDLAEKIVAARSLDVTPQQIAAAKRNKKTLIAPLDPGVTVEITYDTIVVENGRLNIYPDVYRHKRNTVENVRAELRSSGVDDSLVTDKEMLRILNQVTGKRKYTASVVDLEAGKATSRGRFLAVLERPAAKRV
jgi:murein L,D-transpeptidase YcbB/YkuD